MLIRNLYAWIYVLLASAMLAIGRIYDERLVILDFNFGVVFSIIFILLSLPLIASYKSFKIHSSMKWLFLFLLLFLLSPILWAFYSVNEYGLLKYLNFVFIVFPLVLIANKFNARDTSRIFNILLYFILFLAILGAIKVGNSVERLSVLGGGPIVFARWMMVGSLIIFFLKDKNWKNYIFIIILLALSLAAGSRGPVLSFLVTSFVFFLINFYKSTLKLLFATFCTVIIFLFVSNSTMHNIGKADRLITKDSTSKNVRLKFAERSFELVSIYPSGVGIGNWQEYCNITQPHNLIRHQYPHNLIFEVFVELGIVGGFILLILLIKSIYLTFNRMLTYNSNTAYQFLFYMQIFLLLNSFFSGSLIDSRLLFFVIALSLTADPLLEKNR